MLDCHKPFGSRLTRLVHHALAAATDLRQQFVLAKLPDRIMALGLLEDLEPLFFASINPKQIEGLIDGGHQCGIISLGAGRHR